VHALRELAKEHLTYQDEKRNYLLTNIGEIVMRKLEGTNAAINALSKNRQFWLEHDLSGIPKNLLDKIGSLADSEVLSATPTDLFKTFSTFYMLLGNAREIHGVSPIFVEDLTNQFIKLVAKDIKVELVVAPEVLDAIIRSVDRKELEKALSTNLKLFKIEPQPTVAFTVTDYFLSLSFFRQDESFDWSNDLLSYSSDSLEWGQELFAYYVEKSEPVIL
jgi:predicted transcriptional regulator